MFVFAISLRTVRADLSSPQISKSPQYLLVILHGKMSVFANLRNSPQNFRKIAQKTHKILARQIPRPEAAAAARPGPRADSYFEGVNFPQAQGSTHVARTGMLDCVDSFYTNWLRQGRNALETCTQNVLNCYKNLK